MPRNLPDWIKYYLAYTYDQESPESFHIWVALSCIAGVLRRRVWFDMGYFKVYPNLYTVLVAPPGRCKKTTAMRLGRDLLIEVPGINFTPDSSSREKLISIMSQKYSDGMSAITAHSGEFASLLATSSESMVGFLTDIFDCPTKWEHATKGTGTETIKFPYFNLLACTTPDDLARKMSMSAVGIGLTARVVFVFEENPRIRDPIPSLTEDQQALIQLLIEDLTTISNIEPGPYTFDSPETKEYYSAWYRNHLADPNPTGDARLAGFYDRKFVHWIKVAMCVAASRSDEKLLTQEILETALAAIEMVEPKMLRVYAGVGANPLQASANEIWSDLLSRPEGVLRTTVLERLSPMCRMDEIKEVLSFFIETKKIRFDSKEEKYYPIL